MKQVAEKFPDVIIIEMNHDVDHIHLLMPVPPKKRVSDVVKVIKSISGRLLKKKFEYMRKAYWVIEGIWSNGYFVSTVGIDEEVIKQYIKRQGEEDMGQAQLALELKARQ